MPKLTITIQNHENRMTVREMRRELARILSKLDGNQAVSYSFHASLGESEYTQKCCDLDD